MAQKKYQEVPTDPFSSLFMGLAAEEPPADPMGFSLDVILVLLGGLPARQSITIKLHYLDDLSLRQIADRMGLSVSRVSQLKQQGLIRLRAKTKQDWLRGSFDADALQRRFPLSPLPPEYLASLLPGPAAREERKAETERKARQKAKQK